MNWFTPTSLVTTTRPPEAVLPRRQHQGDVPVVQDGFHPGKVQTARAVLWPQYGLILNPAALVATSAAVGRSV